MIKIVLYCIAVELLMRIDGNKYLYSMMRFLFLRLTLLFTRLVSTHKYIGATNKDTAQNNISTDDKISIGDSNLSERI